MGDTAGFKIWDVGDCQTDSSTKMCIEAFAKLIYGYVTRKNRQDLNLFGARRKKPQLFQKHLFKKLNII